jgi:hypothetical protein
MQINEIGCAAFDLRRQSSRMIDTDQKAGLICLMFGPQLIAPDMCC